MDEKTELIISIAHADSLKKMTKMPGWNIIKDFLEKAEKECDRELKDESNNDLANIKACRKIIKFVKEFKDLLRFTDISAEEDQQELNRIKGGK